MEHLSVLLDEATQGLKINPQGIYVDCTFGRGGHSKEILQRLESEGQLLAIDRDLTAIQSELAIKMARNPSFSIHHGSFSELVEILNQCDVRNQVDGLLMDLGVSSPQLDVAERGFSFMRDGPLDMRMDTSKGLSAAKWLRQVDEPSLTRVLFEYGEERFARRIARAIIARRVESPLTTTRDLAQLIEKTVPRREKHKHPATRSFQAIRIEINNELEEIKQGLLQATKVLKPGGRLVVISFHSLEDRIVKRFFRKESGRKEDPGRLPIKEADIEQGVLKIMGKAVKAGQHELQKNPRARSAIMRIAEKV